MSRRHVVAALMALLLAGSAQAWKPAGWSWWAWPYTYEHGSSDWYWFNTGNTQWTYGYPPANGWKKIGESGLASGWSWWAWPYAYDSESGAWYYMNEGDTQWCVNMGTAAWSQFGQFAAPAGMVLIPGGSNSGNNPLGSQEFHSDPWYSPTYSLTVATFSMDRYEVTKAQWDEVRAWGLNHGYTDLVAGGGKAANFPVHDVTWYQCVKWCNARSQKEGRTPAYYTTSAKTVVYRTGETNIDDSCVLWTDGYRLPRDEEWEYAARGGVSSQRFPWGDDLIQHARANYYSSVSHSYDTSPTRGYHPAFSTNAPPHTSPVGSFETGKNAWGLYDMAGNVSEWCWSWYPGQVGLYRVYRGGAWDDEATYCRVGARGSTPPIYAYSGLGFRAVLIANP